MLAELFNLGFQVVFLIYEGLLFLLQILNLAVQVIDYQIFAFELLMVLSQLVLVKALNL